MAESFLGNKISLISKKGIRYEGVLRAVDSNQSTITLSEVVSFGTENRVSDSHVPPCSNVYEYIIFRGSDILDLHICGSYNPPVPQVHYWHNEPAFVPASQESLLSQPTNELQNKAFEPVVPPLASTSSSSFAMTPVLPSTLSEPAGALRQQEVTPHSTVYAAAAPVSQSSNSSNVPPSYLPPLSNEDRDEETSDNFTQPTPLFSPEELTQASATLRETMKSSNMSSRGGKPGHVNSYNTPTIFSSYEGKQESGSQYPYGGGSGGGSYAAVAAGGMNPRAPRNNDRYNSSYNYKRDQDYSNKYKYGNFGRGDAPTSGYNSSGGDYPLRHQTPRYRGRGGGPVPMLNGQQRGGATFKNDYDFEAANAKIADEFAKLKVAQGSAEGDIHESQVMDSPESKPVDISPSGDQEDGDDPTKFYNKKKSFFDSISCESTNRVSDHPVRVNWTEERRLNTETFGNENNRGRNYRGGGSMNSYSRGGGNYYGGRGGAPRGGRMYDSNAPRRPSQYIGHY